MDAIKLLEQLPKRYSVSQKIADRLNGKSVFTKYNRAYTAQNIHNILNKLHEDDNVILELVELVKEYKANKVLIAKKINSVCV